MNLFIILGRYKDTITGIDTDTFGTTKAFTTEKLAQKFLDSYKADEKNVDAWLYVFAIVPISHLFIENTNIEVVSE